MGRFTITGAVVLGALASHGVSAAQEQQSAAAEETAIEVQGDRALNRDEILNGQRQLYTQDLPYRTAGRFYDPVCVAVVGLAGNQNEMVADRIRANMRDAGVALADAGCKPNALVAANRKPKAVIDALKVRDPQLFNRDSEAAIRRQIAAGQPAISWGETIFRANDGMLFGERSTAGSNPAFSLPVFWGALPSRQRAPLYQTKVNAIVFFDLDRLKDVHVKQMADYATLHLLGDPRDPANYAASGVPTILSLFAHGPQKAPLEMTSIDRAYLRGLYRMRSTDWAWKLPASVLASYENPGALQDSGSGADSGVARPS